MAKIMVITCNPKALAFLESKRTYHIIPSDSYKKALRMLEQMGFDLLPDLVIVGKFSQRRVSYKKVKRTMINFARSIKSKFPFLRIVLVNGKISSKRAPDFVADVCRDKPEEIFAVIQKILSLKK